MENRVYIWNEKYINELGDLKLLLKDAFQKNGFDLYNVILAKLSCCFVKEKDKKKATNSLAISFLITSVVAKTYELQICCYDKSGFLDINPSIEYFAYKKIGDLYEFYLSKLQNQIKEENFKVSFCELEEFRKFQYRILHDLFSEFIYDLWLDPKFLTSFLKIAPNSLHSISYGFLNNQQSVFFNKF